VSVGIVRINSRVNETRSAKATVGLRSFRINEDIHGIVDIFQADVKPIRSCKCKEYDSIHCVEET
jgi:hypothetical protein